MKSGLAARALALVAMLVIAAAPGAVAHAMVKSVSIKDGATLTAPPPSITIAFDHPAGFGTARLVTSSGERIELTDLPKPGLSQVFTIGFPRLQPDTYRITWRVIAEDGHVMSGGVTFRVAAGAGR